MVLCTCPLKHDGRKERNISLYFSDVITTTITVYRGVLERDKVDELKAASEEPKE